MKPVSKNSSWLSLLLRWLSGEANRRDEASLDVLARQDEFLREALEGYRSFPAENHAAAVTRMKAELRRKSERRRDVGFYLLRVAAIGAVLVVAWAVMRQFSQQEVKSVAEATEAMPPAVNQNVAADSISANIAFDEPGNLAFHEEKTSLNAKELPRTFHKNDALPTFDVKDEQADLAIETPPTTATQSAPAAGGAAPSAKRAEPESLSPAPAKSKVAEADAAKDEAVEAEESSNRSRKEATDQAAKPLDKTAGKKKSTRSIVTINGKVTDASGEPLIGAAVMQKGTRNGAMTQIDGTFSLKIEGESPTMVVSYTGYSTEEVQPGNSNYLEVVMADNASVLSEVVVVGMGTQNDDEPTLIPVPKPEGGVKKLKKFIEENLRYPAAAAQAKIEGRVKIKFTVLANGTITNVKVFKSLGYGCDEEAIRLLVEGPRWMPAGTATCSIRFKL